jgi:hypothetical protein
VGCNTDLDRLTAHVRGFSTAFVERQDRAGVRPCRILGVGTLLRLPAGCAWRSPQGCWW